VSVNSLPVFDRSQSFVSQSICSSSLVVSSLTSDGSVILIRPRRKDVNILMVYAMCNLHDVSWGTKGDNGAVKDLGSAKRVTGEDGLDMLEVMLPTVPEDVDSVWEASRKVLGEERTEENPQADVATKGADRDRAWVCRVLGRSRAAVLTTLRRERTPS
jgi:hypothetical protein